MQDYINLSQEEVEELLKAIRKAQNSLHKKDVSTEFVILPISVARALSRWKHRVLGSSGPASIHERMMGTDMDNKKLYGLDVITASSTSLIFVLSPHNLGQYRVVDWYKHLES